jgi:hypothetical protein
MAISRTSLVRGIALLFLLLAGAGLAGPVAAEEAVLIPGATLFKPINPFYPLFDLSYRYIGINMHDDPSPVVVDYSQDPLATERALAGGVESAEIVVRGVGGDVVVIGESMGSMVASGSQPSWPTAHIPRPRTTSDSFCWPPRRRASRSTSVRAPTSRSSTTGSSASSSRRTPRRS